MIFFQLEILSEEHFTLSSQNNNNENNNVIILYMSVSLNAFLIMIKCNMS